MFFLSPLLLRSHSKRLLVQLKSAALSNFYYMTHKSPAKKNTRIALRKYDPRAGQHVMFYETRQPGEGNKKRLTLHLQKYIHWTGKNMKLMAKRVERAWEYGAFQKYFDEKYPQLTDIRGRSLPRMK
ncbi:uncharacterized protein LOC34620322 [Cyclospora cayetanensis]|uniref:Uncharacterized protein LOC34620322 n=1 Tax=Cyclospora cayetanensis TaxID=88456 RepID=A0A6P6RR15_9EIME|nr:uncharacterized protein LOC34620322 [Cyclospora cayetanensis]